MARYRVGNKYLSEEEYAKHRNEGWAGALFLVGAIIAGYLAHQGFSGFSPPKWLLFTAVCTAGAIGGGVLAALHKWVQAFLSITFAILVLFIIGNIIWSFI